MCMLFGFNSNKRYEVKNPLRKFFENSYMHPDGWGLCTYWDKCLEPQIIKEAVPAYKSCLLRSIWNESISGKMILAHIRKKTYGSMSVNNTHPFKINEWVLAHNGSVNIAYLYSGKYRPVGETDSEKILCFILNNLSILNKAAQRIDIIKNIEESILEISEYGKLNLILTNGDIMIIHSNFEKTLYFADIDNGAAVTFCTKPILNKLEWNEVPLNQVLVYKDGSLMYEGKVKNNVSSKRIMWGRNYNNEWAKCFN